MDKRPNILLPKQPKNNSFTLSGGSNFANIEFEVCDDDEEDQDVVIQEYSQDLPSSEFGTISAHDEDLSNKEFLLSDSMKIEIEDPEFINCDDVDNIGPPRKKFALASTVKPDNCVRSCAYFECKNNSRKNPKLTLYPFPNNQSKLFVKQYYDWVENAGVQNLAESTIKQKFICEDHFDSSAFVNPTVKGRLKASAIPRHYKTGLSTPSKSTPESTATSSTTTTTTVESKTNVTPVVSVLTDPCCAVCKEKLNPKVNYIKVPDSIHVRYLWEITTDRTLTPTDLICEKHFPTLDIPTNQVSKLNNSTVNIYNHRPTCLPCLTPLKGCCVPNCPNSDNNNITLFTFDLRQADKWLSRIGQIGFYTRTKKDLLRVRICPNHFNPNVLRKYKFFETELIPTRNLPDGKLYPEDPNPEPIMPAPQPNSSIVLTPLKVLATQGVAGAAGGGVRVVPLQFLPSGSGIVGSTSAGSSNVPAGAAKPVTTPITKIEKIVINRLQCLYKNCPRITNTIYKFFKPPTNLERAKKWLQACGRTDILRLPDKDLEDFMKRAEGLCEVHIGSVYREKESNINRMICGYKLCQSTYSTGSKVFRFPSDPELRKKWFEAAGIKAEPKPREMDYFVKSVGICISHFSADDFDENRELLSNAVPLHINEVSKGKSAKTTSSKEWTEYADPNDARNKAGIFNSCVVSNCLNDIKTCDVPFHYFPSARRDLHRYQLWVEMVREPQIKNVSPNVVIKMYRICADHFEDYFFVDAERKLLKNVAVPTVNVPGKPATIRVHPFYHQKLRAFLRDNNITALVPEDSVDLTTSDAIDVVDASSSNNKKKKINVPMLPPRPKNPPRLMQWVEYEPDTDEKDDIKTKCIIEQNGLSFPNLGKKLCLANPEEANSMLPFDVYKFDVSTMATTQELTPGNKLQIHTAIIIDDDDWCEQQVMAQIFKLLKKQHDKENQNDENPVEV